MKYIYIYIYKLNYNIVFNGETCLFNFRRRKNMLMFEYCLTLDIVTDTKKNH